MCSNSSNHACSGGHCCCGNSTGVGPLFWSKKKRIRMVKDTIDCLQSQVKGLKEDLRELGGEQ